MASLIKKVGFNSPVVLSFALVSLLVLAADWLTGGWTTSAFFCVYRSSPLDPAFYIRLLGHSLGHADLSHYVSNMMVVLLVGPIVEEKYGGKRLIVMMAVTSAIIGVFHMLFSSGALLGASGIAFMLIVLASLAPSEDGTIPLTFLLVVALYLGDQLIAGLFTADNISHFSHILGGIMGIFFGLAYRRGNSTRRPDDALDAGHARS